MKKYKISRVIMSHLSDIQHVMLFDKKEANTRLNFIKKLIMEYPDTDQEIDEKTLNEHLKQVRELENRFKPDR